MKSFVFFITIAAALVFTSCAEREELTPTPASSTPSTSPSPQQATNAAESLTDLERVDDEADRSGQNGNDLGGSSTTPGSDILPQGAIIADSEDFMYGTFAIAMVDPFDDHVAVALEDHGRRIIVSEEPELWTRVNGNLYIPNLQYAAYLLESAFPDRFAEWEALGYEIRIYAFQAVIEE